MTLIQYKGDVNNERVRFQFRFTDFELVFKWNDSINRLEGMSHYSINNNTLIKDVKNEIHNTI